MPEGTFSYLAAHFIAADAIIKVLEAASDIIDNAKNAYQIGKGLTKKGVHQLGKMLANLTIGDLEALLDLNNADPSTIHQIIEDLIDLTTALVSIFRSFIQMYICGHFYFSRSHIVAALTARDYFTLLGQIVIGSHSLHP